MKKGTWLTVISYVSWGLLPVYWRLLHHVPPVQVLMHRVAWSCVTLVVLIMLMGQGREFLAVKLSRKIWGIYFLAALLIMVNWSVFIWAIDAGRYVEASLGYFINPLLSVLIGVVFLRERLRPLQWLPIALASAGVIYLTIAYGRLPWISLLLALSFALYGLVKKFAPLNSVHGLVIETAILFLPALIFLVCIDYSDKGIFLHLNRTTDLLLIGTGAITSLPMITFSAALRRIPLSLAGVLQYIAPTLQFLLGVLWFREPFSQVQLIGFGIVWLALLIFGVEGFMAHRAQPAELV